MSNTGPRPDDVTVTIPVTITVDLAAYEAEYGQPLPLTPGEFARDELDLLLQHAPTLLLSLLNFDVGFPEPDDTTRRTPLEADILTTTHEYLAQLLAAAGQNTDTDDTDALNAATGVVYAAVEYDDGWFVVPSGATVYFAGDRLPVSANFLTALTTTAADVLDRQLTAYTGGARGPQSAVSVDLATGQVEFDPAGEAEYRRRFALAADQETR